MINQGLMLLPNVDPTQVRAIIENQFGAEAVNSDKSDVEQSSKSGKHFQAYLSSKQNFRAQLWNKAWWMLVIHQTLTLSK